MIITIPSNTTRTNRHTGETEQVHDSHYIVLQGYRITSQITCAGQVSGIEATIDIYDPDRKLVQSIAGYGTSGIFFTAGDDFHVIQVELYLNSFSDLEVPSAKIENSLGGMRPKSGLIFKGSLQNAVPHQALPDPFMTLQCNTMTPLQLIAAAPTSFKGAVKAQSVASIIASRAGLDFENHGVDTVMTNPYLTGNTIQQIKKCALQGLFEYVIDGNVLAIWPRGQGRQNKDGDITIEEANGMIGPPDLNGVGITLKTLYRPDIAFGDTIQVKSSMVPNATGRYTVRSLSHRLSARMPDGPWETQIVATIYNKDMPSPLIANPA